MILAERVSQSGLCGEAFNFGLGQPATALEVVETIIRVSEYPYLKPLILDEVRNEIRDEYLSADKAQRCLGWQPKDSLESGLAKTMAWYRDYLALNPEA